MHSVPLYAAPIWQKAFDTAGKSWKVRKEECHFEPVAHIQSGLHRGGSCHLQDVAHQDSSGQTNCKRAMDSITRQLLHQAVAGGVVPGHW